MATGTIISTPPRSPLQTGSSADPGALSGKAPVITIGKVSIDGRTEFTRQPTGIINDYRIRNRYEKDGHIYTIGLTSPGGFLNATTAFCQLSAPTLLWVCDWTACRFDGIPPIPVAQPLPNSNWVLLDEHYEPGMIEVAVDGSTPVYRISGTFVYAAKNPAITLLSDIRFSRPPWLNDVFQKTVSIGNTTRGLIGLEV